MDNNENELFYCIENAPKEIKDNIEEKFFEYGEKLLVQGEICEYVYILISGSIKTYHRDLNGDLYLEDIDSEPTIFGELEAFTGRNIITTVEAIGRCKTFKISKNNFLKWIEVDHKFSIFMNKLIAQRNYDCSKREKVNAFYPLKYRILYTIMNTLYRNKLGITKDLLAEGVGSSLRSVNRVLKELIDNEILEYNGGIITIKSFDKLIDEIHNFKK